MKIRFFVLFFLLLGTLTLSAQGDASFTPVDCPFELPAGEIEGETIECGFITVPESRTGLSDASIDLAIVILYSEGEDRTSALLYLAGGPGNSGTSAAEGYMDDPAREAANIVFIDQRGTGYSVPSLDCTDEENEYGDEGIVACYERLVSSGIVLDAYRNAENAADVNDVISALDLESVALYGMSYGTRLALTIMKDPHPAIQAVILDGVYPPSVHAYEEDASNIARVFNRVFEACGEDSACNEAYPDLAEVFYAAVDSLNNDPLLIAGADEEITGNGLMDKMFQSFYSTSFIPDAPSLIYAAYYRDEESLAEFYFDDESEARIPTQIVTLRQSPENDGNSEGMFTNFECADEVPFNSEETIVAEVERLNMPPAWKEGAVQDTLDILSMCQIWAVTPSDASARELTVSDLPTLILNGEYDPVTPPHWAEIAAETLSNSYLFIIPAGGHGVIHMSDCTESIASQFLDDPTTEPDGSCVEEMPPPQWYIDES